MRSSGRLLLASAIPLAIASALAWDPQDATKSADDASRSAPPLASARNASLLAAATRTASFGMDERGAAFVPGKTRPSRSAKPPTSPVHPQLVDENADSPETVTLPPLYLRSTSPAHGDLSARVSGEDPTGSGPVNLWRRPARRPADYILVAEATADSQGRFDFGQILIPSRGIELVAARRGEKPDASRRGSTLRLEPDRIGTPNIRVLGRSEDGHWHLSIRPARSEGFISIEDTEGQRLQELQVQPSSGPSPALLEVRISARTAELARGFLRLGQHLPDGRSSPATRVHLRSAAFAGASMATAAPTH